MRALLKKTVGYNTTIDIEVKVAESVEPEPEPEPEPVTSPWFFIGAIALVAAMDTGGKK